jgi:HAD superfamily hydrolase (TIGR01459 family)
MFNDEDRMIRQIGGLAEIAGAYDVLLCDVWGVVHDGVAAFPPACASLSAFRRNGGTVVMMTNAPRPSAPIYGQLARLGFPTAAYDSIATSGDVTIELIVQRIDAPVLHIGPARDLSLFEAAGEKAGRPPRLVAADEAAYALCTGLRDDVTETPDDYEPELRAMLARGIAMICANPDIVIHRGDSLVYCAGALAERYATLGGEVIYAGKPYGPIYEHALALAAAARGRPVDRRRVLAVGDGMRTDIAGAVRAGLDCLLVTNGIHRAALHGDALDAPAEPEKLRRLCAEFQLWPTAAISALEG